MFVHAMDWPLTLYLLSSVPRLPSETVLVVRSFVDWLFCTLATLVESKLDFRYTGG